MSEEIKHTAICYTDGSAGPTNPGFYSGGCHAYIYITDQFEKNNDNPTGITITDKGYRRNEDIKGAKINTVKPVKYIDALYSYNGEGTNNMGELLAAIETIENLLNIEDISLNRIALFTDSMYVINIHNNLIEPNNDWRSNTNRPNYNLWIKFSEVLDKCNEFNIEVFTVKVKAHFEDFGNNLVDRLAWVARLRSEKNKALIDFKVSEGKKYWKPKIDRHPFLRYNDMFFNGTMDTLNETNVYTIMKYPSDVDLGKRNNNVSYGVVKLSEEPVIINKLKDTFNNSFGTTRSLSYLSLKNVFSRLFIHYYNLFGDDALTIDPVSKRLEILTLEPLAAPVVPPGLANKAIKYTIQLRDYLDWYYKQDTVVDFREFVDVTDYFYKDKKLLLGNEKAIKIKANVFGKDVAIVPEIGIDLLDRIQLKSIEKLNPKVTMMVIKESERIIKYYFIIELLETNDIGIWTSMFSNYIVLKEK